MSEIDLQALAAEFPRAAVSWRAQTVSKAGDKALALAYIDARDVMERLDAVVGPANWSDAYDVHQNVTICTISIRIGDSWVTKADGAGDTDVEAEKGRISDAFKRAAVKWSIGRYIYAIASPWVPCESYDTGQKDKFGNTKWGWRKWTDDPWNHVRGLAPERSSEPRVAPNSSPLLQDRVEKGLGPSGGPANAGGDTATVYARLWTKMETLDGDALIKWQNRPEVAEAFKGLPEKERLNLNDAINQKLGK
jgi:hypothetical protein